MSLPLSIERLMKLRQIQRKISKLEALEQKIVKQIKRESGLIEGRLEDCNQLTVIEMKLLNRAAGLKDTTALFHNLNRGTKGKT